MTDSIALRGHEGLVIRPRGRRLMEFRYGSVFRNYATVPALALNMIVAFCGGERRAREYQSTVEDPAVSS
jgi:hypothetical protein